MVWLAGERITADRLNELQVRPYLHAYQITTQSIPNNADTVITFDGKFVDTLGVFNTAPGQNGRYTPTVPGWYECYGQVAFSATNLSNDRAAQFQRNGVQFDQVPYSGARSPATGSLAGFATTACTVFLNGTTDFLELTGYQNITPAGPLQTFSAAGQTQSFMIVRWMAP